MGSANRIRLFRVPAALAAVVALALTGCTTDLDGANSGGADNAARQQEQCKDATIPELPELEPVSDGSGTERVKSEFGQVKLPRAPKKALGMYTTDVDTLIWLRYPLAKTQPIRSDAGYKTFPCFFPHGRLAGTKTFPNYPEYDYESLKLADPDFILNGLGYDKKTVKRLPQIAPTYSLNAFNGKSWMTHFEQTAEALGREKYFDEWKRIYDRRIAEIKKKLDKPADTTAVMLGFWDGKLQTACGAGVECQAFEDLGLRIAPTGLKNDREGEALSGEQLGKLDDVDYAFMIKGLGKKEDDEFDKVIGQAEKNPLWTKLPFVEQEHIVPYEMEMTFGSPSGQLAFLDVLEEAMTK